jgi:hypothetical protein
MSNPFQFDPRVSIFQPDLFRPIVAEFGPREQNLSFDKLENQYSFTTPNLKQESNDKVLEMLTRIEKRLSTLEAQLKAINDRL